MTTTKAFFGFFPITLFVILAIACYRIALMPVDVQAGSLVLIGLALLVVGLGTTGSVLWKSFARRAGVRHLLLGVLLNASVLAFVLAILFLAGFFK